MNKNSLLAQLIKAFFFAIPLAFAFNIIFVICLDLLMGNLPDRRDILKAFDLGDIWTLIFTVIHFVFGFLQAFLLLVPVIPSVSLSDQKHALWPRVVGAAFLCSVAIAIPVLAGIDILRFTLYDKAITWLLIKSACGVWVFSWVIWIFIIWSAAKRSPAIVVKKASSGARLSLVGLALCVPWYWILRKKESCECSLATFYSLVAGIMSLLIVGGPLLLVLARDRKVRNVFDS
jgi:hypothetical protein